MTAPLQLFATLGRWTGHVGAFPKATLEPLPLGRVGELAFLRHIGVGRIAGTVKVIDTAAPNRRVRLYDKASGTLARETMSDGGGLYAFERLDTRRMYYVIAEDAGATPYNATIEDFVTPA